MKKIATSKLTEQKLRKFCTSHTNMTEQEIEELINKFKQGLAEEG